MAVASATKTQERMHPPVDPSRANFVGLISAALILFAFLFMPWYWGELKYNGARLMSEAIIGGTFQPYTTLEIILIPITALVAALTIIWGIGSPERGKLASYITLAAGVVGLYYFVHFYFIQDNELIDQYVQIDNGFKLALVALIAMIAQSVLLLPQVDQVLHRVSQARSGGPSISLPKGATPYLFLAIPLALYLIWIIVPTAYTFYLSLTNWDSVSDPKYLGLDNFDALFDDGEFHLALENNVRWFVLFITVPTTMGLGLAMIFNTEMRGGRWYKVSFYSPLVLSGPVIALVWSWLYHPDKGLINTLLTESGLVSDPPGWLADRDLAIYCIIAAAVWRQVGYVMVLYLAGLKNLDPTLMDAGLVDGANRWQLFRHVIFPLLAPITTIIFIISVIDSLRAFDLVQIMTRGNQDTEVLANYMYMEAFNNYRMGYGAAIAVILFSLAVFFVGLYLWRSVKEELEY